ncbi:uncharacterized protein LOC105645422 isoform X2 [Jatropha curcas]|uniref:uncharacterized protein LOC105645422 isoform X2 n=1 Tax=Jatropha curcas TaxID=180498 RepID=UPI0005FC1BBA|nr:uncharacterized protein LOC105645422 isoform X2 [Jatropha curcas]
MAQLCGSNGISIKLEGETNDSCSSNELDHVPLMSRRKLLMKKKMNSCCANNNSIPHMNVAVIKKEDEHCDPQGLFAHAPASPVSKETDLQSVQEQLHGTNAPLEVDFVVAWDKIQVDYDASDKCSQNSGACQELSVQGGCDSHGTNVDGNVSSDKSLLGGSMNGSIGADFQGLKPKSNISNDFTDDLDHIVLKERRKMLQSRKMEMEKPILKEMPIEINSRDRLDNFHVSANNMSSSTLLNLVKVKGEPVDNDEFHNQDINSCQERISVKSGMIFFYESNRDKVDHMQLRDRMKLQIPREDFNLNASENFECLRKDFPSSVENGAAVKEASNCVRINRPRKRKKTATDSIETAMEEDAPGLLQVLIEQGVSVDEIKLYGERDNDEPIGESFIEDGFAELEAVISKIFFQRNSLLKFAPLHCTKGSKPTYCLACLFSLVEQVKRLVTAMKLTNCGRISLIENKTLVVGEDLTEGEAQVLTQYGWTPNSGIGTMLNYRDRVVHDRKNEKDNSEWRSKIGKLLMDGYNGGSIISSNVETRIVQCGAAESPEIKMEL